MWTRGEIVPKEQFLLFSTLLLLLLLYIYIYIYITSGVKLHIHLLNVVVQLIVFLTLYTLICRSTDISKCFSESLGIRDNGSRLYINRQPGMLGLNYINVNEFKLHDLALLVSISTHIHEKLNPHSYWCKALLPSPLLPHTTSINLFTSTHSRTHNQVTFTHFY